MSIGLYMLDTNVFNALRDGYPESNLLPKNGRFLVTSVQMQEINAIKNPTERKKLLDIFSEVATTSIPTETALWGYSTFNESKFSDGVTYQQILESLSAKNTKKNSNMQDVLIAETSIANGCTLITSDKHLHEVVLDFHGKSKWFEYVTPKVPK